MIKFLTRFWWVISIVVLTIIYHTWFYNFGILTHGDWNYYFNRTSTSLRLPYFSLWLSDNTFGRVLIDVGQAPTYFLYGVLAKYFGISYNIAERLIHLWPAVLFSAYGSYKLAFYTCNSKRAALIAAAFFTFSTDLLQLETGHLTLAVACAISPLVLYLILKLDKELNIYYALLVSLTLSICNAYEPRIAYILLIVFALHSMYRFASRLLLKETDDGLDQKSFYYLVRPLAYTAFSIGVFLCLNFYWLYGLAIAGSLQDNEVTSRGLFGNSFYDIRHALSLYTPFWTGKAPEPFIVHNIPFYYWLLPIFAFLGAYFARKKRNIVFFSGLSFLGILLSKQVDQPFTSLYFWLYTNLPGFNAFREASKFYILITLGYTVLIACFSSYLLNKSKSNFKYKYLLLITAFSPLVIPLINSQIVFSNSLGTLFINRTVPNTYDYITDKLSKEYTFSRVYWLPINTRWSYSDNNHPIIHAASIVDGPFNRYIKDQDNDIKRDKTLQVFNSPYASNLFNATATKYVVVPPRNNGDGEDLYEHHGYDRNAYIQRLDKVSFLKKIKSGDLAVYENSNIKPYIDSTENVYEIDDNTDINQTYALLHNSGVDTENMAFTFSDGLRQYEHEIVSYPFGLKPAQKIKRTTQNQNVKIFFNPNVAKYSLVARSGTAELTSKSLIPEYIVNSLSLKDGDTKVLSTFPIEGNKNYLAEVDASLFKIMDNTTRNFGNIDRPIRIFSEGSENQISNNSFEKNLWQAKVENCNNYGGKSEIGQIRTTEQAQNGRYSLKLISNRHTACTHTNVSVDELKDYNLRFKYKTFGGHEFSYQIKFNDPSRTVIEKTINPQSREWTETMNRITAPAYATKASIYLSLPPDDRNQNISTAFFDDVSFNLLDPVAAIDNNLSPLIEIDNNAQNVDYKNNTYIDRSNMIQNGSFENGSWQDKVGDCNEYDSRPNLKMFISNDSKVGKNSLALLSKHHTACISQKVPLTEKTNYNFSFDYKSPTKSALGYSINFDDPKKTNISKIITPSDNNWTSYSEHFTAPFDSKNMYLTIYTYPDDFKSNFASTLYDNFAIKQQNIAQNALLTRTIPQGVFSKPVAVSYKSISNTYKKVHIVGAKNKFYLNMSEAYHDKWTLQLLNNQITGIAASLPITKLRAVSSTEHFKYNDFGNGWLIDTDKLCATSQKGCVKNNDNTWNIDLAITFAPQRNFHAALLFSFATLITSTTYVVLNSKYFRKRRNP